MKGLKVVRNILSVGSNVKCTLIWLKDFQQGMLVRVCLVGSVRCRLAESLQEKDGLQNWTL